MTHAGIFDNNICLREGVPLKLNQLIVGYVNIINFVCINSFIFPNAYIKMTFLLFLIQQHKFEDKYMILEVNIYFHEL